MANLGEIWRVLGHRDFRRLWLAQSASVIGDNIVLVALALFVIAQTGSATDLGIVLAAHLGDGRRVLAVDEPLRGFAHRS